MAKTYSNETMRLLYERASCRNFLDKPIPDEVLNEVIDAGLHAATGGNLQPYAIVKFESDEIKSKLVDECHMQQIIKQAPMNLLFCIDWRRIGRWAEASHAPFVAPKSSSHFWISFQDTIIAAQNICTAADSVGLGSVYIGTVESCFGEVKEMFHLPEGVFPVVILSMGYPAEELKVAPKLGIEAMVHEEHYHDLPIERLVELQEAKYDHRTYPASDGKVQIIYDVAKDVGDEDYAKDMVNYIKKKGHINMAQRYFGLHYRAYWMAMNNETFVKELRSSGFTWIDGENFPKED